MTLSWLQIFRLGLVQLCIGAVVVLTTSTLNRLMAVELGLPAMIPGALVGLHYAVQISRPGWGLRSDTMGKRTTFVLGGMVTLASGAMLAALAVALYPQAGGLGLALSVLAYLLIGLGVGASGTALLALLATATAPHRRAAAATITWLMMILGIAVTAGTVGALLDPYAPRLLLKIVACVCGGAVVLTALAIRGIETHVLAQHSPDPTPLRQGLAEIWREDRARVFTLFVFLSMVAYFMQELILEPYAGLVFGFSPGQSTSLSGAQNGGVFVGMLLVGVLATGLRIGALRHWVVAGCLGSALALAAIAQLGMVNAWLTPAVVALGFFNGVFAVATIGAMMAQAGEGRDRREGTRMGLWGAAQAFAAALGGFAGTALVDLLRLWLDPAPAFGTVFLAEAGLFLLSAVIALRVIRPVPQTRSRLSPSSAITGDDHGF